MANTFSVYCREYINNQETVLGMFNTQSLTQDLVKPLISHRGKYISYDQVVLGSSGMGTFNRDTGYPALNFTSTRVEKELTQDVGDKLYIDLMDQEEAQIEGGTVRLFNQYLIKNAIPTIDAYRFSKLNGLESNHTAHASITSTNIVGFLLADKAVLEQKRIKWGECIVYIAVSEKAKLDEANINKAYISMGAWNGDMSAEVALLFGGAKLVAVPDATLGTGIAWSIVHPLAFDAFSVYQEAVFFDKVPGFGGRRGEVDVGFYHDAWVQPNGEDGILSVYNVVPKPVLIADETFTTSKTYFITGLAEGGKVYYTNDGNNPTAASTLYTSAGIELTATKTIKAIQIVNGVSSSVASATYTKSA